MKILGIETSCDETAAAVVTDDKKILSNVILSQLAEHKRYGGVVPEIAARAHVDYIEKIIEQAMREAELEFYELDGVAVTSGPGLIGGVIVGVMAAKAIAAVTNKPLIAVNHLEGHALTARLTSDVSFPYLLMLVSGGHSQILAVEGIGKYKRLGTTIDDAVGEAFDKVAKMTGLGYPGGPQVEQYALKGNSKRFDFPRSMKGREGCDFSFSGLKTAVKREIDKVGQLQDEDISDICASFQATVADIMSDRINNAIQIFSSIYPNAKDFVIAGGVAANKYLSEKLINVTEKYHFKLTTPPLKLCTDNAAMIAWAGVERLSLSLTNSLDIQPRARWSLEELNK
jgi:N6-L-threonylcarbamoyladenine synthase